jgi:hypothetical protein
VVADGRGQPGRRDPGRDRLGGDQVRAQRLLDEERQAAGERCGLQRSVGERRDAQPHGVELLGLQQRGPVGVGPGAEARGGRLGPCGDDVGDRDHLDVVEAGERGQVPPGDEPRADDGDPQTGHRRTPRRTDS